MNAISFLFILKKNLIRFAAMTASCSTPDTAIEVTDDEHDEDQVASSVVPPHPCTSPAGAPADWVAKANSTSFILNDKITTSAFTFGHTFNI